MMKQCCDLHTHSVFSDGTLTPTELVGLAEHIGLGAVALTDHNTLEGIPEFLAAARGTSVKAVPGVEFSVDYLDGELHIVALYIRPEHNEPLNAVIRQLNENKQQSNLDLIANLNRAGYAIRYEQIKKAMPEREPNRALIAAELTRLGYTSSIQEAFQRLLSPKHGYYHPPKRVDVLELIALVHRLGAVPVWAHPFLHLKEEAQIRAFLPQAKEAGLQGMEVRYSTHSEAQTALATALAQEYALLPSGGSDFHGDNKPTISLGIGHGGLEVPLHWCEALEQARR